MKVYFACSITGGRADQAVYALIVDALLADGHDVPTAILASTDATVLEAILSPEEVYQRDRTWIEESDALVAEVSTPSHGVGYEIAHALGLGKYVFCCYRYGKPISKMISGNPDTNLVVRSYSTPDEAMQLVRDFILEIQRS
jgi:nucleoside 2-deoxyribosyltransferase